MIFDASLDDLSQRRDYARLAQDPGIDLIVIWQIEYAAQQLASDPRAVFVPMYDGARHLSTNFWQRIPHMRILCFSIELYNLVSPHCSRAIYAQYAPARPEVPVTRQPDSAYYWYRRDDVGLGRLRHIINTLKLRTVDILVHPDFPASARLNPRNFERLSAKVKLRWWEHDPVAQLRNVAAATYFIASRRYEGIGMSFLEAMSLGCIVVAPETSTYTDYIVSGHSGLLYDDFGRIDLPAAFDPHTMSARSEKCRCPAPRTVAGI